LIRFLFLTVSSPFSLGVYDADGPIKEYTASGKASDVLPPMIDEAIREFAPEEIYYTNGPGNHMSLKIAFVCLKALCVIKKIPLYGVSPFVFNGNSPIKAFGNSYFVSTLGKIELEIFEEEPTLFPAVLPGSVEFEGLKGSDEPLFLLSPV
jgi:tRNA A37 threonylcarbamoyladenosine modification protein TsaB